MVVLGAFCVGFAYLRRVVLVLVAVASYWLVRPHSADVSSALGYTGAIVVGYWLYVHCSWRDACSMGASIVGPILWPGSPTGQRSPRSPGLGRFLLSNPLVIYQVLIVMMLFALLALWRSDLPELARRVVALAVAVMIVRIGIVHAQRRAAEQRELLLLRRFSRQVSMAVKSCVIPVLAAYGRVETLADETIESAPDNNPERAPYGDWKVTAVAHSAWREKVLERLDRADAAIVDVSEVSGPVAWEIARSVERLGPERTILVCEIDRLMQRHATLAPELCAALAAEGEVEPTRLLAHLERPLPFSINLANLVFAWRLGARLESLDRRGKHRLESVPEAAPKPRLPGDPAERY